MPLFDSRTFTYYISDVWGILLKGFRKSVLFCRNMIAPQLLLLSKVVAVKTANKVNTLFDIYVQYIFHKFL